MMHFAAAFFRLHTSTYVVDNLTGTTEGPNPIWPGRQFSAMCSSSDSMLYVFGGLNSGHMQILHSPGFFKFGMFLNFYDFPFQISHHLTLMFTAILEVYIDMIRGQTIGMTLRQCCNFVRQECIQVQVLVLISQNQEEKK
jgi:hypothetical protein